MRDDYYTTLLGGFKIWNPLKRLPVTYKGVLVGDYEADFVIEGQIILEIKAVSRLHPKHQAQALHYLTATGFCLAILLNFGASSLQHQRVVK